MDQQTPANARPPPVPIVLVLDAQARVTWSGGPVDSVFGRQPSEVVAAPVSMLIDNLSFRERVATVDLLHANGTRRHAVVQIDPWRAANAQFFTITIPASDVPREREQRELARDAEEARRMSSLGRVAATMAHEFNNVLAGIGSFAEYLVRRAPDDDSRRAAANIRHAIHRGKRVTNDILRYTRAARPKMGHVDVRGWLQAFMPEGAALTNGQVMLDANESLSIRGDVAQLNQVLVNLVINARDASAPDMPIEIRAGISTAVREGVRMLDLAVIDHGTGIPPDARDRIFEPLFTTKPSGTGLGLPLVDRVVRAHGGVVRVRSEMGKGSEFHVLIPLYEGEVEQRRVSSVLIVDDNEEFAGGTKQLLAMEGIHARVVHRAADVIPALEQEAAEALVLDIGLPDMAGTDVYAAIIDRWPELPVVFVSGHRTRDLGRLLRQRHVAFLEKPFGLADLLDALSRVTTAVV